MRTELLSRESVAEWRWEIVNTKNRAFDGAFFFGVSSTGIYEEPENAPLLAVGMNQSLSNWVSKGASRPLVKGGVNAPPAKTRRAARL